jgi:hypothetical protein
VAGNLSASNGERTWILTSYLASNAIVPITGWFAGLLGRKRFFMVCLAVFSELPTVRNFPNLGGKSLYLGSCKVPAAADCGLWLRHSWQIRFRLKSAAWHSLSMASPQGSVRSSDPPWAAGLQTTTAGAGFSLSILQWAFWRRPLIVRLVEDPPWAKLAKGAGVKIDYIGLTRSSSAWLPYR